MSLAKLTSLSTQTLSLLLERQRLQTLPSFSTSGSDASKQTPLHLPQITKNLAAMRRGILELENKEGRTEALGLLRNQYERMRDMLGGEGDVGSLDPEQPSSSPHPPISASPVPSPSPSYTPMGTITPPLAKDLHDQPTYTPYTDDPAASEDPGIMLQTQRHLMNEQDEHLDRLSHSINRQHHISLQINDELDVHTGLLEELDTDIDRTHSRLGSARRRLDRVAKGAKENSSTVTIALLILVLLILIIVFKT